MLKRFQPAPQGRAHRIRKRTNHVTLIVENKKAMEAGVERCVVVASPEKALFDLAYFSVMNRRRLSGTLPETNLKGFRWNELQGWLRRIPTASIRAAVQSKLRRLREQHAETDE